jgi:hypothetical protein
MSSSLRNGLVAFAMAATAVVIISVALLLTIGRNGSDSSQVGGAASVTPAILGATQTPALTPSP